MVSENLSENRTLRADVIVAAIGKLHDRIHERFGERGLTRAARDLRSIGERCAVTSRSAGTPNPWMRVLAVAIIAASLSGGAVLLRFFSVSVSRGADFLAFVQATDAAFNIAVLASLGIYSLFGIEKRVRRARALEGLHELRSIAHIIDMHQLTKDPASTLGMAPPTKSSPARDLDRDGLLRYLDYCSEMLALISKLAALYGEQMRDSVVMDTVNGIEDLTSGLSRKIWQKIIVLQAEGPSATVRSRLN